MLTKIISLLSQTSLFSGLEASDLTACALAFREKRFAKGQTLFLRGDPGTHVYLVETGLVRLAISNANGRRLSFQIAMEGDLFGEIAALDNMPRTADATALTAVTVHCLERHVFGEIWSTRPVLATRVVLFLCNRLRQTTNQIESIALQPVEVRLARFILSSLGDDRAPPPGKRLPVELGFSQGELSQLLGATRPKVNAAIASLEKAGAVRRTPDRLFCDPVALARIAQCPEED
jgi:CRP/FNR family transcriptional regulator, cyclic AMP receptor protein